MTMKYEYLEELKNNFINALQDATKKATNEDDMNALDSIAEDLVCEIPTELMQKDYWTRSAIIGRLPEEKQQDTQFINGLMKYIYNEDAVYMGDYVVKNIDECFDEYVGQQITCDFCGRKLHGNDYDYDGETIMCKSCQESGKFGHYNINKGGNNEKIKTYERIQGRVHFIAGILKKNKQTRQNLLSSILRTHGLKTKG